MLPLRLLPLAACSPSLSRNGGSLRLDGARSLGNKVGTEFPSSSSSAKKLPF